MISIVSIVFNIISIILHGSAPLKITRNPGHANHVFKNCTVRSPRAEERVPLKVPQLPTKLNYSIVPSIVLSIIISRIASIIVSAIVSMIVCTIASIRVSIISRIVSRIVHPLPQRIRNESIRNEALSQRAQSHREPQRVSQSPRKYERSPLPEPREPQRAREIRRRPQGHRGG